MLALYRQLARALHPWLPLYLRARLKRGKEDAGHIKERLGSASLARPSGKKLLWIHAASVGESQSVLPLIGAIQQRYPHWWVMVTTGTVTSARLMKERLPAGAFHQYMYLDTPQAVARFLSHWKPDAALWVESELWPNTLLALKARGIPAALINGRLSDRSYRRWLRARRSAAALLGCFCHVFAQSEADAQRFRALGAANVSSHGNLKNDSAPLKADELALRQMRVSLGTRPRWLAASLHPGEVEVVAQAHKRLCNAYPDILTLVVPRHPGKGETIRAAFEQAGCKAVLRSRNAFIEPYRPGLEGMVYIADTMGELGLYYRISKIAFIGGSLIPHGGQNPLEAARLDNALLFGEHMFNFEDCKTALIEQEAAIEVTGAPELAGAVLMLLTDTLKRDTMAARGKAWVEGQAKTAKRLLEGISPLLGARQ
jgi:3-deoxy-D-manno-octulosonic-acid transferase